MVLRGRVEESKHTRTTFLTLFWVASIYLVKWNLKASSTVLNIIHGTHRGGGRFTTTTTTTTTPNKKTVIDHSDILTTRTSSTPTTTTRNTSFKHFFSSSSSSSPASSSTTIPKILWLYWDKGLDHLKQLAKEEETATTTMTTRAGQYKADYHCVQAWHILNPTWDIRILNHTSAQQYAPKFSTLVRQRNHTGDQHNGFRDGNSTTTITSTICPQKLSNLLRLEVLSLYGGVYTDTSVCPMQPLDTYMSQIETQGDGFFAPLLNKPGLHAGAISNRSNLAQFIGCDRFTTTTSTPEDDDKNSKNNNNVPSRQAASTALASNSRSISNWFLVSTPHHVLIDYWLEAYYQRLVELEQQDCPIAPGNKCKCIPYFTCHCIFTLQRLYHEQVEKSFQTLLSFHQQQEHSGDGGLDVTTTTFCQTPRIQVANNVTYTLQHCRLVKKQQAALLDYVQSPAYLQTMKRRVSSV